MNKEEFRKIAKEEYDYSEEEIKEFIEWVEQLREKGINVPYEDYLIKVYDN